MVSLVKLTRGGMMLIGAVVAVLVYIYVAYNRFEGFIQEGVIEPPQATPVGTFTMYYADWCGHCKTAKPDFEELVKQSPIIVGGRAVNIRMVSPEKEADKVDAGAKIDGFPTFYFKNDKTGQLEQYGGERNVPGYKKFLEGMVKNV